MLSLLAIYALLAASLVLPPALVALVVGSVSPWLVALVAHSAASSRLKRVLGGLVAVVIGVVEASVVADGSAEIPLTLFASTLVTFAVQQLSYFGVWKRLNLNRWRWLLPALGLGKPPEVP